MSTEVTSGGSQEVDADAAARRLAAMTSPEAIDRILADAQASGTPLDGENGLLNQLTKAFLERALGAEMDDHLGYEKGDPAGRGSPNSRNGSYPKTVTTNSGPVRLGCRGIVTASSNRRSWRKDSGGSARSTT